MKKKGKVIDLQANVALSCVTVMEISIVEQLHVSCTKVEEQVVYSWV